MTDTQPLPSEIKKEILRNHIAPNDAYGWFHTIWPIFLLLSLFVIGSMVHPIHMIWLVPLIGWADYRIYFPLHDTCHFSLFKDKALNRHVGYVLAAILATPYDSFRKEHVFHHTHYSTENDPGMVDYFVHFKNKREMALFLLSPLWGGTLLNKLKDYFRQILNSKKVEGQKDGDETHREAPDYAGYAVITVVQLALLGILTGFQLTELWRYPAFVLLPGATVFLFLSRLRMFLEHGSLDYEKMDYFSNPRITSRTFECNGVELAIFSGAGFKYHYEHHLLPSIPSCQLKTVHEKFFKDGRIDPEDTRPSYIAAIRELWSNLK